MAENLANDFATTLAGAVDNSTGTLTVVLASGAPAPNFRIRVDDELMLVTAVAGTTWTVTRGIEGTAAASHASGAVVVHVLTAGALAALFAERAATQTALDAKAPLASPTFTGNVSVPNINGAALGPKNKLFNGCMRIPSPYGASGGAALGGNLIGAAGVVIWIGGFTTFTGAIFHETGVQDIRTSSGGLVRVAFASTTGGSGFVIFSMRISAEDALTMAGKPITASCRLYGATTSPATSWLRRYKANGYNDFSAPVFIGDGSKLNTSAMAGSPIDLEYTFTPTYADCINGMHIDVVGEYTGANGSPQSPSYLSVANFQVIEGSKRLPFEARPLELEKALVNRFKPTAPINLTANTTLASNAKYSYSASITMTLPASPENGDTVTIYNLGAVLTTVVGRNGKTIMGLAQDMTLDIANRKYLFEYLSASGDWRLS